MRFAILVIASIAFATGASAQTRPHSNWQQIESDHFRVIFEPGLDSLAQHAARRAEAHHSRLTAELSKPPRGKIDIILGDNLDLTNGAATIFPSNRIYLWAKPPVDDPALNYHNDWMDLVIAHELTHIFHMDRTGAIGRAIRTVFGRVPWGWPVFPVIGTPDWTIEGLATYRESRHTGVGRTYGPYHEMIIRTAILENDFDPIDRVNGETPMWPGGQRAYIYGSMFMDYIAERFGEAAHREYVNKLAGSVLPPPWIMNSIARRSIGQSFSKTYDEWRSHLQQRYTKLADSVRSVAPITTGERIAGGERNAFFPRISPDGQKLAYVEEDGRNTSSTVVLDLSTRERERTRRNSLAQLSWANNTTLYTTQPDFTDPFSIYSDIYTQVSGNQRRVTRGGRYDAVDVDRSGRKLIAVKQGGGTSSLVQIDAATGAERVIVPPRPHVQWVTARWSPDGNRIAAEMWMTGGIVEVVVMDTLGDAKQTSQIQRLMSTGPAWSPDGRYVLYTLNNGNIPNVFAMDLYASRVPGILQITNTLTGAFYPEVSPDRRWIYYSAYHSDGFAIERILFDTTTWIPLYNAAPRPGEVALPESTGSTLPVRKYNPLRSALPKWWAPFIAGDSAQGTYFGFATFGYDDVERHSYSVALAHNFDRGRTMGYLDYTYAGLGNPILSFGASREYNTLRRGSIEREDIASARVTFLNPRWRSNLALSVGAEAAGFHRDSIDDRSLGVTAGLSFANIRRPAYAISAEDGIRTSIFARRRFESYSQADVIAAGYKSISGFGYAHHVLAGRGSYTFLNGGRRTDVGGITNFLPVRGFDESDRIGSRGWSTSLEYRLPLLMIGRGTGMFPMFVDRTAASLFVDAGNASGYDEMLLSAGVEVGANVAILSFIPTWYRVGAARPLQGPASKWQFYLALGPSF